MIDQRPAAGTEVEKGRQVVIIIGVFVEADVITARRAARSQP